VKWLAQTAIVTPATGISPLHVPSDMLAQTAIVTPATGDFPAGPAGAFLLQPGAGARANSRGL